MLTYQLWLVHRPPSTREGEKINLIPLKRKQNADNITDEDLMEVLCSNELDLETASKTGKIQNLPGHIIRAPFTVQPSTCPRAPCQHRARAAAEPPDNGPLS
jgi:hypothetical protein